ncbi:MAG: hypothetical protein OXB88_07215 [Bacteriovoracales bacterium]|nr:hypothetical protein [Bacteriovoracales bacterium]
MMDFEPTEEESKEIREEVKKAFANAKVISPEENIKKYREFLDKCCKQFNVSSHYELMSKADIGDLDAPAMMAVDIVDIYTLLQNLERRIEKECHGEETRKMA